MGPHPAAKIAARQLLSPHQRRRRGWRCSLPLGRRNPTLSRKWGRCGFLVSFL